MNTYISAFLLGLSLVTFSLPPDLVLALPTSQSKRSPQVALEQVLISPKLESKWFSPKILEKVPLSKLQESFDDLKAKAKEVFGDYKSVQFIQDDKFQVIYERGKAIATIRLDQNGGIASIGFDSPEKL
jgi:hypothetical protein